MVLNLILHYIYPIKIIIFSPYNYLGLILVILGIYLNLHVHFTYKRLRNPIYVRRMPRVLITSGAFRFSRNPLYLGMVLILLGEAMLLTSAVTFILPIVLIILLSAFTIPIEERNLEKKFGKKYLDYKKKVRRWI